MLVGTFDWELVADTEPVIAGFTAACYASSSTGGGGLSTPEEAAALLDDCQRARGDVFSKAEQRAAVAAAAWIIAFNARWQVGLLEHGLCDEATRGTASHPGRSPAPYDVHAARTGIRTRGRGLVSEWG